jgi:gliding motility-associated-like protein
MILKLLRPIQECFLICCVVIVGFATRVNAQCAGTSNSTTVCDIKDISSRSVNLYSLLGGSPLPNGVWKDNLLSGGLNTSTGFLNAQSIKKSGVYTYTYTVDNGAGCKDSATITVTIGGYAGVSSPNVSACSDDTNYNLFLGFNGNFVSPQSNGIWTDNNNTGALTNNFFNASRVGVGTYSFTYTMPAIGGCDIQQSTVYVTVFRAPEPGAPSNLLLCDADKDSFSTSFDLNSLLTGEDAGGVWEDLSGTTEITSQDDSFIDVKQLYTTYGARTFNFRYSVDPDNPICTIKRATVSVIIEKQLDFTGAKFAVNTDICENEIGTAGYNAVLTQGIQSIPDGSYFVTYRVNSGTTVVEETITAGFTSGRLSFALPSSYFQQVGAFDVTVVNVVSATSVGACATVLPNVTDVLNVFPIPKIDNSRVVIDPVCKGNAVKVVVVGNNNLSNGLYDVVYRLSGSNIVNSQKDVLTVTNGEGVLYIPANLLPNVGSTVISISNITNLSTLCTNVVTLSKDFVVNPLPDVTTVSLSVNSACQGKPIIVMVSGLGVLSSVVLRYNLSGANSVNNQSVSLTATNGNASFEIPTPLLVNTGNTIFTLTELVNTSTGCSAVVSNVSKSFVVNAVPISPITQDEVFCVNDFKKVSDLTPNGVQYQWFISATSTVVLAPTTVLVSGDYYVKEVVVSTGCESTKSRAKVTVNQEEIPVLSSNGEVFCGLDKPTVADLSSRVVANGALIWFDAATNGNIINGTTLLVDRKTYYGFSFSNGTSCVSNALEVTISLSNCDETADFFVPDGFSPNGDGVNDSFRIPKIDFIYPDYSLEIYNRYGNLMFKGNKSNPEWDGRNSNFSVGIDGIAPNGVYFYVINFNKNNKAPVQGSLYLNR